MDISYPLIMITRDAIFIFNNTTLVTKRMCVKFGISITARTWPSFVKITGHGLNNIYTRFNIGTRSKKKYNRNPQSTKKVSQYVTSN